MSASELKVSRKATILNRCTSTESRWNKNDDSLGSPETETNRSPSSYKKCIPSALTGPMVSKATGMKMCVWLTAEYLDSFLYCCLSCSARRGGCGRNIRRCEGIHYSGVQVRHRLLSLLLLLLLYLLLLILLLLISLSLSLLLLLLLLLFLLCIFIIIIIIIIIIPNIY